jgi:predicted  nucleic acid-binding Zn-ribbon protein
MNSDLKQLIRLQTVDLAIQEIRTRIDKFPAVSKALDEKLKASNHAVDSAKERVKLNQSNRKKFEGEVSSIEAKISKYREQMMSVKTNEEYKAVQKEIEYAQQHIRKIEDDILNLMMEHEGLQTELKVGEGRLKEDQQRVSEERKELEKINQQDISALEAYVKERRELEKTISEDLLPRYERVRKARGGIAVAQAKDYVCDMCKVRIRPQVFQEIRKNDRIIACDACQRILYFPDNLDHPFEVA